MSHKATPSRKGKRNSHASYGSGSKELSHRPYRKPLEEASAVNNCGAGRRLLLGRAEREKGKRGERMVASLFKDYGYDAHRTAQFKGKTGDAGDVEGVPGLHIEVKFQEKMHLYDWTEQAVRDSEANGKGNKPAVFHKASNKPLLVTMRFEDWIELFREWEAGNDSNA